MSTDLKLTNQETKVINFLSGKVEAHWEELAQFAKDPQTVKLRTMQKVISDLRKKYAEAGVVFPFNGKITALTTPAPEPKPVVEVKQEQTLVQIKRTPEGNVVRMDSSTPTKPMAHIDFELNFNTRSVKTRYGSHLLNEREWDMMKYLHANVGRVIKISELRDKVVYPQYGSKLPPRWFDHVKAIIGNLRAQVPGLKDRILTVKGAETSYLFQ